LPLHAAKEAICGSDMPVELKRRGDVVSAGTLYPILHGPESAGYRRSEQHVVAGKVRRCYDAAARGKGTLEKLQAKIRELTEEVLGDDLAGAATARRGSRREVVRTRRLSCVVFPGATLDRVVG
jgi:DNA-binding PadR family transcriptional regulator